MAGVRDAVGRRRGRPGDAVRPPSDRWSARGRCRSTGRGHSRRRRSARRRSTRRGRPWTRSTRSSVRTWLSARYEDPGFSARSQEFVASIAAAGRVNSLAQKLVQLTMPGVPDVYQGCEVEDFSLVDPDNRRPVDYQHRRVPPGDGRRRAASARAEAARGAQLRSRPGAGMPARSIGRWRTSRFRSGPSTLPTSVRGGSLAVAVPVRGTQPAVEFELPAGDRGGDLLPGLPVSLFERVGMEQARTRDRPASPRGSDRPTARRSTMAYTRSAGPNRTGRASTSRRRCCTSCTSGPSRRRAPSTA